MIITCDLVLPIGTSTALFVQVTIIVIAPRKEAKPYPSAMKAADGSFEGQSKK
jgi:hypothetical protein